MRIISFLLLILVVVVPVSAQDDVLTIYSGRSESLIAPLIEQFTEATGIEVEVLYAGTAAVANQILEEGENSPADAVILQDAGALGALAKEGILSELPEEVVSLVVEPAYVSPAGLWVGVSGRARVLVYNPELLEETGLELPESIFDLTGEEWRGLVGWVPTNASLQTQVTAIRLVEGDDIALEWLEGIVANEPQVYEGNGAVVEAVIAGEIPVGLVNHYYLYRYLAEDPDITTTMHYFPNGDLGALVNVAGAGVVVTTNQPDEALQFVEYLLSEEAQIYFAEETFEYPLIEGVETSFELVPLDEIEVPEIDLSDLDDLQGTLEMIEASGALDG
jgi:iron(III) transport system substrate-binding protein